MRLLLTTLALLCGLAVLASPAAAETTLTTTGSQLTIAAAPGVRNDVTIGPGASPGMVRISDTDTVTDDGSCVVLVIGTEDCTADTVVVALGDGNDRLSAAGSPVPLAVDAGDGARGARYALARRAPSVRPLTPPRGRPREPTRSGGRRPNG